MFPTLLTLGTGWERSNLMILLTCSYVPNRSQPYVGTYVCAHRGLGLKGRNIAVTLGTAANRYIIQRVAPFPTYAKVRNRLGTGWEQMVWGRATAAHKCCWQASRRTAMNDGASKASGVGGRAASGPTVKIAVTVAQPNFHSPGNIQKNILYITCRFSVKIGRKNPFYLALWRRFTLDCAGLQRTKALKTKGRVVLGPTANRSVTIANRIEERPRWGE
jgi:hypothetical protein